MGELAQPLAKHSAGEVGRWPASGGLAGAVLGLVLVVQIKES